MRPRCHAPMSHGNAKSARCGRVVGHKGPHKGEVAYANQTEATERRKVENPESHKRVRHAWYHATKHDDLTYLYYSPGLRTHKIGHTVNLKHNEMVLRRACWDIQLIDTFKGGRALESWLHQRFDDKRVRGEWFRDLTAAEVRKAVAEWPGEANVA